MKRSVKVGYPIVTSELAGDYYAIVIVSSEDFRDPDTVYLTAHVSIDRFGGHRHYFRVWTPQGMIIETESLEAAIRNYAATFAGGK